MDSTEINDYDDEERGVCCFCNEDCNILSQACGSCSRGYCGYAREYAREYASQMDTSDDGVEDLNKEIEGYEDTEDVNKK